MTKNSVTDRCSWFALDIVWEEAESLIGLILPARKNWGYDVIEFLADGSLTLSWRDDEFWPRLQIKLEGSHTIKGAIYNATVNAHSIFATQVKPPTKATNSSRTITVYCHGIYRIASTQELFVLVSPFSANKDFQIDKTVFRKAVDMVEAYREEIETWRQKEGENYEDLLRIADGYSDEEQKKKFLNMRHFFGGEPSPKAPVFGESFCSLLANAEWLHLKQDVAVDEQVSDCIYSGKAELPARTGNYAATALRDSNGTKGILINWFPETSTGFPEVKSAAEAMLPDGFAWPRLVAISPPRFPLSPAEGNEIAIVDLDDLDNRLSPTAFESMSDLTPSNSKERAQRAKDQLREAGLEAFGWYQPFHVWSDETWGIYLHAEKIEDLASAFFSEGVRHFGKALILAIELVYEHEYFHARTEAVSAWLEVVCDREKYRSYKHAVYDEVAMTENWLEEALANWTAMMWVKNNRDKNTVRVVQEFFELSPPGYRDWSKGDNRQTWRKFSSELVSGVVAGQSSRPPLPIEQILKSGHGFELLRQDIPTRFVGKSSFVDHFFSVPSRKEVIKVLKYYGYSFVPRKGKGSHDTWCNAERKCFGVPQKDPVSRNVFDNMLKHLGITKKAYVFKIRPLL